MRTIFTPSFLFPAILGGILFLPMTDACSEESDSNSTGFYFDVDLGVAVVNDIKLVSQGIARSELTAELSAGPRLSLGGGYNFYEWFGAGLELSVIQNEIQDAHGAGDYYYWQVPLMANFEFRLPNKTRFTPMIGGGPGVAYRNFYRNVAEENEDGRGHMVDYSFVWQVYGGLRYRISDRCSLGVMYKYLALPSTGESNFEWGGDNGINTRVSGTRTQSVSASFRLDF